jgi:hypothetical protein
VVSPWNQISADIQGFPTKTAHPYNKGHDNEMEEDKEEEDHADERILYEQSH